ncbi:MAG: hypothetical protein ACRDPG_00780 [Nocardioidaceae bacterium]
MRLLDATDDDIATVTRQLGPLRAALDREPDIIVRFADRVTLKPLTYVGLGETGYNEDGFFILKSKGGAPARTLLRFDSIDECAELVCEHSSPAIPHLLTLINLVALAKGVLPLHASAYTLGGGSVLVTGWSKGGKTESLLAAMSNGAHYVGDEWVYLTPDARMFGIPEPIRLWDWQLRQLPELLGSRGVGTRLRLASWRSISGLATAAASSPLPVAGAARRGAPVLARQAYVQIPPAELFGRDRIDPEADLDAVVLLSSHESERIVVELAGEHEVSGRMAASLSAERAGFMSDYNQFRYAFPGSRSELVDDAANVESTLLRRLFDGRPAAKVGHAYPCQISELGQAVLEAVDGVRRTPSSAARHAVRPETVVTWR